MKQVTLSDAPRPRTHLFTVRVWLEDLGDGKAEWRGQVKHVMSGEVRYFREWQTLLGHLKAVLARAEKVKEETPENKGA
ncbi:MAG TPA: hypothetical protein VFL17_22235 [Anaerolineae bacterium]|nr:hypothetical protein [Anaerolineae bacterium]